MPTVSAGQLLGSAVCGRSGEYLGQVADVVLDGSLGTCIQVLLAVRTLGGDRKLFAVPWSSLHREPRSGELWMQVDRVTLERSPGLEAPSATCRDTTDPDAAGLGAQPVHRRSERFGRS